MNKELQDRTWALLPTEYRKEVRELYQTALDEPIFNAHEDVGLLEHLFGKDNLTSSESDESPNEDEESSTASPIPKYHIGDKIDWLGNERIISAIHTANPIMYEFEGCTGMLTEDQIDLCFSNEAESEPIHEQKSVQFEPIFSLGDIVKVVKTTNLAILNKIGTIETLPDESHSMYKVRFSNGYSYLEEYRLKSYTEENIE